ncbi:MAG: histidinol phosphatase [Bacteroidetes bacterium]|nr:MAG: histidinol phosphatase [Bacteroidota bacterium]
MFSFLKNKKTIESPFSMIGVDMHSHLIPGIDDGAQDLEDSVNMISKLRELGFTRIITTPHTYKEYYPNTSEGILEGLKLLKSRLQELEVDMEVEAASEYFVDEHFAELLENRDLLTLGKTNYVLIEISFFGAPPNFEDYIFQMGLAGYQPVLAHPERYSFYANNFRKYQRLVDLGCALQINALSLTGRYGSLAMKTAEKLLKNEMVTFFGTDCHNMGHANQIYQLGQSSRWKKYKDYPFQNKMLFK